MHLRIATFNLENLDDDGDLATGFPERARVLRRQLARLDADILCLQEVHGQRVELPGGGYRRELRALRRLLEGTPFADYHLAGTRQADLDSALDVHNLAILSRLPLVRVRQVWHQHVPPLAYAPRTAEPPVPDYQVRWERPILAAAVDLPGGRSLHVLNVHLRAPVASFVRGQKLDAATWRSTAGWAEGYFLAALKRDGQALEARLEVEHLLNANPRALIALCGDCNAEARETALRIMRAAPHLVGTGDLAARALHVCDETVPLDRRFSIRHDGRPILLDHILASSALFEAHAKTEIHNEDLLDDVRDATAPPVGSFHAPIVVEFRFDG
ncbi:MAG: endonuclease/exonuclease/phosphatase family protein [Alphaproteobacteria bacterium]